MKHGGSSAWVSLLAASLVVACAGTPRETVPSPVVRAVSPVGPALEPGRAEVVLLGGLHEHHKGHERYPTSLVARIIADVRPSTVLIEYPVDWFRDGRPTPGVLRLLESARGDETDVAWQYCKRSGVPCLPYDIARRNEYYEANAFAAREEPFLRAVLSELETHQPLLYLAVSEHFALKEQCRESAPEVVNSSLCDAIVATEHELRARATALVVRESSIDDKAFGELEAREWSERNRVMAENICNAAKDRPGERILVTTGYEHRYRLKQLLRETCQVARLREYWELVRILPP